MADIQTLLSKILNAVYGKDVRQSIHDSIKQCYYDGRAGTIDLKERERAAQAEATINSRIDKLASLKAGSTTGDAELMDARVGFDGTKYDNVGNAVRSQAAALDGYLSGVMQKDGAPNAFQPLMFKQYKYHNGSNQGTVLDEMEAPRFTLGNFEEFIETTPETEGSSHAFIGKLVNPIPVFSDFNNEYTLIVKSSKAFKNDVYVHFASDASWNESVVTLCSSSVRIAKGYNVIPLETSKFTNNGASKFTHIAVNAGAALFSDLEYLEIYIVKSDALFGWLRESRELNARYITPPSNGFVWHGSNNEPEVTINGSKISVHVPATASDEAIWRYTLIGYDLGTDIKGKKILIRTNSVNKAPMFGIGTSFYAWRKKDFKIQNGECKVIDLESFIADNADLSANTGHFYVTMGRDFGTTISIPDTDFEFDIMFISDKEVIDPYEAFVGYSPSDFAPADNSGYIACWGDSLTAGGGWTSTLANLSGRTVYNGGTGGENVKVIAARQGADAMIVNNITIPADTTPVTIASRSTDGGISTVFGNKVMPLLQGGAHVNPVMIGGVEGTLAWTGSNYADTTGTWTFTRSVAGDAVTIDRETVIRTEFDRNKNTPHLMVIFMGQNGGFSSTADLINTHKLMINHAKARHVIILGLSSGTASERAAYESAMKYEFGRYFISLREYLSKYGLADAGLTPTDADIAAMANGKVPPQLLTDGVHFTSATKTVIGNMLYKKCVELNIF